jgi:vacuolar-type H+-ATPase subunit I/STV1
MADHDQEEYGAVRETVVRTNTKSSRSLMVAGAIAVTMAAALALLANNVESKTGHIEDMVGRMVVTPDAKLENLVHSFAKDGATMSLAEMEKKLDAWRHNPSTILDMNEGQRMQALVGLAAGAHEMSLEGSPTLCAKKDVILSKFDELLKKLGAEELALNITNDKVMKEQIDALKAWLDSESDYRLTVQKAKDAKQGSEYAEQQYEKYNTAYNDATKAAQTLRNQNNAERQSLVDEQNLIQEIMRLVGILDDGLGAGAAAKAVKGSTKLLQTPQEMDPKRVKAELKKLEDLASKVQQPKMRQQLAKLTISLDSTTETGEVAAILKQMLQDIEDRIRILNNLDAAASAQADTMQTKLIEWQTKLVDLSNAKDKAQAQSQAQALQRQTLAGAKKQADAAATEENAAYKLTLPPYLKEIFVITTIKKKIAEACA